jgi:DNA-binding CsgD family transcriptional regulator
LHTALDDFNAMGLEAFAERTRLELAAKGETVRQRSLEKSLKLTPQELQIARMVAAGHTNPEIGARLFLSPRTVEWHLGKVFAKLGVASRRQLRDLLPHIEEELAPTAAHATLS